MQRALLIGFCALSCGYCFPADLPAQESGSSGTTKLPFRIARETTYITAPLTDTGLVDYPAYLNREMSKGVTPENNAAVLYWKAIGKSKEIAGNPGFFEQMKQALGTDPFAEGGPYLVSYAQVYKEFTGLTPESGVDIWEEYNASQDAPWTSAELPAVKRLLERNEKPLETVLAATRRPHYYRPLVGAVETDTMIGFLLPDIQQFREMARLLKARALLAIGEDRPADAIRDLLALHRLARHSARGATLIEMLVGGAIESVAHDGDQFLADSEAVTAAQLTGYAKQLAELPPPADIMRSYQTERFLGLDIVQRLASRQLSESGDDDGTGLMDLLGLEVGSETVKKLMSLFFQYGVDWNQVLIGFNDYHDQVQSALEQEQYARRTKAMADLTQELSTEFQNVSSPSSVALAIFSTPEQRAKQMKSILLGLLAPALEHAHEAGTRGEAKADLSRIGIALSACQKQHGQFPASLEALVPEFIPDLPSDPYTGNAFVYRVDDDGALIYSLGNNLQDDGGKTVLEDNENHDHVFRVKRR